MNRKKLLVLLVPAALIAADSQWMLTQSSLTYHVSHPLHESEGVSHVARGKGVCQNGVCNFLIAVPVKSFESGDTNRDLHMQQATRGAQFPMVTVRAQFPEGVAGSDTIHIDLDVEFAGQTAHYKQISFQRVSKGDDTRITGTIPATLTDFKIDPPSLLSIPIKNDMPIRVDLTWRKQ
jgi:hypothetical protein